VYPFDSIRFSSSKVLARQVRLVDCYIIRTRGIKGSSKVLAYSNRLSKEVIDSHVIQEARALITIVVF
jgi:hypothetical protein